MRNYCKFTSESVRMSVAGHYLRDMFWWPLTRTRAGQVRATAIRDCHGQPRPRCPALRHVVCGGGLFRRRVELAIERNQVHPPPEAVRVVGHQGAVVESQPELRLKNEREQTSIQQASSDRVSSNKSFGACRAQKRRLVGFDCRYKLPSCAVESLHAPKGEPSDTTTNTGATPLTAPEAQILQQVTQ
jgi:hypothetical protein